MQFLLNALWVEKITKPKLTIAGNSEYTIEEISTLSQAFSDVFTVKTMEYEEFSEATIGAFLVFTLQGVTSGFLQAIGEQIWMKICDTVAALVASKAKGKSDEVEFDVTPEKSHFRICSQDRDTVREAIKQFPKALEWAEKNRQGAEPYFEFDDENKKWKE